MTDVPSANLNNQLLKDTARLVNLYQEPRIRELINSLLDAGMRVTYQGRPLAVYGGVIVKTAAGEPNIQEKYKQLLLTARKSKDQFKTLLDNCYKDEKKFGFLKQALQENHPAIPVKTLAKVAEEEKNTKDPETKARKMEQAIFQTSPKEFSANPEVHIAPEQLPEQLSSSTQPSMEIKPEMKYVAKTHPKYSSTEELKKLDELMGIKQKPPGQLISPSGQPLSSITLPSVPVPKISAPISTPIEPSITLPVSLEILTDTEIETEIAQIQGFKIPPSDITQNKSMPNFPAPPITPLPPTQPIQMPHIQVEMPFVNPATFDQPPVSIKSTPIMPTLRTIRFPEPVQKWGKDIISFGKRFTIRHSNTLISTGVGGAVGGAVGLATGNPIMGLLGAGGGAALPQLLRTGAAPSLLGKAGGVVKLAGAANPIGLAVMVATSPQIRKLATYAIIGVLAALFGLPMLMNMTKTGALFPPYDVALGNPIPGPGPGGGGNISSCTFYRGGDSTSGLKFGTAGWPTLINEVANKVNVPAPLLAGILRVECAECFASNDSSYITNDYDIHPYPQNPNPPAFGAMQFTPTAFINTFNSNKDEVNRLFGKLSVSTELRAQNQMEAVNALRIYSVKDSLIAAAYKIRNDKGSGDWTDRNTIDRIAERYYGCLAYGGPDPNKCAGPYNYGKDLWDSYQGCKSQSPAQPPINPLASCPVDNGEITCASFGLQYSGTGTSAWSANCAIDQTGNGGHCNQNYKTEVGICKKTVGDNGELIRTAKSIDVTKIGGNNPGDPVLLPAIQGKPLKWTFIGDIDAGTDQSGKPFGYIRIFHSEQTPDGVWSIHFVHVNNSNPPSQELQSGQVGATMFNLGTGTHVHVTVGLNVGDSKNNLQDYSPDWKFADRNLGMCVK